MRLFILAIAITLSALVMPTTATAQHPDAAYVACEVHGLVGRVEQGSGHGMSAQDIEVMRGMCVRDALYHGRGEDYWSLPVTDADIKAARFTVRNVDYFSGTGR